MKILFLCDGNTCRSPVAEAVMNKKAFEHGLDIVSESAGLQAFSGDEANEYSVKAAGRLGVDISGYRSRKFSPYMAEEYDLFVVMSEKQKKALAEIVPQEKIHILSDGIADPCGENEEAYCECAEKISEGIDRLITELSLKISPMVHSHIDGVALIEKECFSTPWTKDGIESELSNENARFFVAEYMGETAGYLGMHIVLDECYIANVAVREKFRRKGIADKLLSVGEEKAKEESCAFISLEVRVSNEKAIALYKKKGYNEVGTRKNFYSDPTENALIMTKNFSED